MSFSRTELGNALKLLSERLPEFSEKQAHTTRLLRITSDRLSSQQNELLKTRCAFRIKKVSYSHIIMI